MKLLMAYPGCILPIGLRPFFSAPDHNVDEQQLPQDPKENGVKVLN